MAEILERINELRTLPAEQHLFCPRTDSDDASVYYDEDVASLEPDDDPAAARKRKAKIQEAEDRKWVALEALQILAYDGEEAAPHKEWLLARLEGLMTSCDVCVRVFHQSRSEWQNRLVEQFEEQMVHDFLRIVDDNCLERIQRGLNEADRVLREADPKQRGVRILPSEATYAFFEALSCDSLIRNEELLQRHFDGPFKLVQTKKRLKLQTFIPAMTRFLFSRNEVRRDWAALAWSTSKRNILKSEFEWAVRDHLVNAMSKVQMGNLDLPFVATYWSGVVLIVNKLNRELITHSIRDLEGDFYRLLLDHLSLDSEGFLDLITTMRTILERSPTDFWDAMDAITPNTITVVEQVFNSPVLKQLLLAATEDNTEIMSNLHDAFSWITPFLASIKPATLEPAVRAFANALFGRFQSNHFSRTSRAYCFKEGLRILDFAFRKMCEGKQAANFVGQPTVNKMLEILSTHIELIVTSLKRLKDPADREDLRLALSMIQHAFTLEAHSLNVEKQLIQAQQPSPTETPPSSPIWKAIIKAIDAENIDLATHLLIAGRNLIGLEPLSMKVGIEKIPATVRHFNSRFALLSQSITDVVDRLAEFDPKKLSALFEQPAAASALISLLFSSTKDTRDSSIELLKVISSQDERRDALQYILRTYYKNALVGISDSCRQVSRKKVFAAAPSMVTTCTDIIDVMCNSQDGILRSRKLDLGESGVTMNYWRNLWSALTTFFATTEAWSNLGFYDKKMMMDFCRDVMQFADQLFDQCSIFATALRSSIKDEDDSGGRTEILKELLSMPADSMEEMKKWLRLRDEFLSSKSVTLIRKLLIRLHDVSIFIDPETLQYMEEVLTGRIKARLSMQQQAELQRALETHLGHSLNKEEEEEPLKPQRQASLSSWMTPGATKDASKETTARAKLMSSLTPTANAFAEKRAAMKAKEAAASAKQTKQDEARKTQQSEFMKKRQLELERMKKEKEAAIAKARQARGLSAATAEAGSGLEGLGILGKDQAAKGEGLMHSSDESDNEGDFDEELFGIKKGTAKAGPKTNIINAVKIQMPVKKRRVQRSMKDMRARLAPDLSPLHKTILGWDYFHEGDFPPNSKDNYARVLNTFMTPNDYQATFRPLLTLEAWQGFVKAREENQAKPYEVRIVSRASVDAFQEVSSTMTHNENRDIQISEGDIVLLSRSDAPSAREPHCLARVYRVQRKQAHIEVSYRVTPGNSLQSSLVPHGTVYGTKIQSITPLEREYGALLGLQYYDLCDEIIRAKPSPLLTYKDSQIEPLVGNYNLNKAQAKAVKSAIDNDAFTLIQGPPGSGKTKTIVAIVGAILSDSLRNRGTAIQVPGQPRSDHASKKLLVCAPSNAAVDELVMRFKGGIKTMSGEERKVNIVRLGRSDAINANVQDVTLEALVNKKLGMNPSNENDAEATRKLFQQHKEMSEQLRQAQDQMNSGEVKGAEASKLQDDIIALRRQKALLGTKIDSVKDAEKLEKRNAELNRRRAQEQILNDAHIICGTLSGSGHEMFQNLSIEFETVIVDEAAQCVEMSALIPLKYGCAKCILVGDPKQLPPTVFSKEAARFQYEQSLFVRMQNNYPNDIHLLDTQYRMHPEISMFPSQTFYDGKLLDGGDMAALRKQPWHKSLILGPYRFFDVQGQHQAAPKGHSLINIAEINIAMQLYRRLTSDHPDYDFRGKVGIITPYKSQLRELKNRFTAQYGSNIVEDIDFNTTDAFQGRESEVIIFSCVRASPAGGIGFLQDIRRMNVGLTRAKSSLWVLGNSQSLVRGEFWRKLVEDAKSRQRYTDGDVSKMLNKHSSAYPAKPGMFDVPVRQAPVKQEGKAEPISRSGSNHSSGSDFNVRVKQEASHQFPNGKRKHSHDNNEDTEMMDVDTEDATSEAASNTIDRSGTSTPVYLSSSGQRNNGVEKDSATPEPTGARPGDVLGKMTKPKILKRRPREPPNPLITNKRPKR
ncbi:tRNA-splicing endonuclease-like protein [Lentithecium fluviatile CBS 122367]|uniref:tRNA-splicing endonuclease-like protein n=1 Tax=Lentithecium fluviatile CBS 122367 TaxID=1168545 RepID=A0A6G1JH79_9PLEO|nr:tRNA-splicing endonuclease-like protein [Lentithecium fluviatile CBS 122367]